MLLNGFLNQQYLENIMHLIIMILFVLGISIILAYTKANIWSFLLGVILCLVLETFIFISYCFIKVQKAYRDSFTIKLQQSNQLTSMNLSAEYPFPTFYANDKIYMNKYTEEAVLNNKKQVLKSPLQDQKLEDITFNNVSCKQEISEYIQQMRQKYKSLNRFNETLVLFGIRMKTISDSALLFKNMYHFARNQSYFKDDNFSNQFREQERRAFNLLEIKLKSPKIKNETNPAMKIQYQSLAEEIVLPTWQKILKALESIGVQFKEIQLIRQSNSDMFEIINKKIMQQYEVLEKQISDTLKSLQEIKQNLQTLRSDQKKLDKHQSTNARNDDNNQLIYWLKKQYFEFTNLTVRIKQNQNNYKRGIQKMRYYTSKISTFYKQQKEKYDNIIFTRYISFIDSYGITLEESMKKLASVFNQDGYTYKNYQEGPPRVKAMIKSKNMNEVLAAELTYQQQYFQRVQYYKHKIDTVLDNMESIDNFLIRLKNIFGQIIVHHSQTSSNDNFKKTKKQNNHHMYFTSLHEQLSVQSKRIYDIIQNLQKVNKSLEKENRQQLLEMVSKIKESHNVSTNILNKINIKDGPIRQKYKLLKADLTQIYKQMEDIIDYIKYFQKIYQKHHNRIKKILIVSFINFVNYQIKMIRKQREGDYLKKYQDIADTNFEDLSFLLLNMVHQNTKIDLTEDFSYENQNRMETGYILSEQYKNLLNRFLFVAYTEWSQSQLFKNTISKEIYIALNEEHNQRVSQIIIEDFQLSGMPPQILWVKQICSEDGQFIIDANISFKGKIWMKISTIYYTFITIPIEIQIAVQEFYSVLRLCFITNDLGCSWLSFIGEPIIKIIVNPRLGNVQINFETIVNMFQSMILKKLKEMVFPIKKKIAIPLYKKDQAYQLIQNRFKTGMDV